MKHILRTSLFVVAAMTAALVSCSPPSLGIFYALEKESPVPSPDKGLPKTVAIRKVYHTGSNWVVETGSTLYVASGSHGSAKQAPGNYTKREVPAGYRRILTSAYGSGGLYATFLADDGRQGLFHSTDLGVNWTLIESATGTGYKPWDLLSDGTTVLLVKKDNGFAYATGDKCQVFSISGTTVGAVHNFVGQTDLTYHPKIFLSIPAGDYFVISNDGRVFQDGAIGTWTNVDHNFSKTISDAKVYDTGTNTIMLVSPDGTVMTWNGNTATASSSSVLKNTTTTLKFTSVAKVAMTNDSFAAVVAGTDNLGLVTIDLSGGAGAATATLLPNKAGNYYSSNRFGQAKITSIAGGTLMQPLMVSTVEQSLWSAFYDAAPAFPNEAGLFWTHE